MVFRNSVVLAFFCIALAAVPARAGTWEVVYSATNSNSSSQDPGGQAVGKAVSQANSLVLAANVLGITTGAKAASGSGAYSGTWTITWKPSSGSDWPAATTILGSRVVFLKAACGGGSGSVSVVDGSSVTQVSASLPNSVTSSQTISPTTETTDTTTPGLTKITDVSSVHSIHADSGKMLDNLTTITNYQYQYTAAYFTSNFATPSAISLTYTAQAVNYTANSSYTGANSTDFGLAAVFAHEAYSVKP
jgi:hypothetical protein